MINFYYLSIEKYSLLSAFKLILTAEGGGAYKRLFGRSTFAGNPQQCDYLSGNKFRKSRTQITPSETHEQSSKSQKRCLAVNNTRIARNLCAGNYCVVN